jgi:O-antigen ligase
MLNRISRYLLYLLLFILPLQTRYFAFVRTINNQWWEYGSFTIYASECLLWFLAVVAIARYMYKLIQERFFSASRNALVPGWFKVSRLLNFARKHGLVIAFGAFVCYALISIVWSSDRISTALYGLRLIEVCIFIALIAVSEAKFQTIAGFFVAGVFANAILGISQFYVQTVWGSVWFGIAAHNPTELGVAVVETYLRRYLRAYGGFPHPNIFGGWLVAALMCVPFLYSILSKQCHSRGVEADEAIYNKSLMIRIGLLVVYAALFTALVMSFSRSAWAGFTLGLVALCVLVFTGTLKDVFGKKFNVVIFVKFLFITGIMGVFLGVLLFEPLVERGSGLFAPRESHRLEQKSIIERFAGASDALKIFREFPIFGVGLGAYTSVLHTTYRDRAVWDIQPVHSVFLMVVSELGIVGGILALAMLLFLLRHLVRTRNFFGLILFASFLPLLLFDHYVWTLYSGLMLFGAIVGISLVHKKI